jgi:ferredoxin
MNHQVTLRVNPVACTGHGACAELLPELISRDEWGYPLLSGADPATGSTVPAALERPARRAAAACPALALLLTTHPAAGLRGNSEAAHTPGAAGPRRIKG